MASDGSPTIFPRARLDTNASDKLYRELRSPSILTELFGGVLPREQAVSLSIVYGGDDVEFSAQVEKASSVPFPKEAAERLDAYACIRRLGISSKGAITMLTQGNEQPIGMSVKIAKAIADDIHAPSVTALRPIKYSEPVAIDWIRAGELYGYADREVAVLFWVNLVDDKAVCVRYVIDSREIDPKRGLKIRAIADRVKRDLGKVAPGSGAKRYWSELRSALAKHGIDWRSPVELNPQIEWE